MIIYEKICFLTESGFQPCSVLEKSETSLGVLEKFERRSSSHLSNIIFETNVLVVYLCFKIYFLIDYHCKTSIRNF